MSVRCTKCGEELMGAVNRCWRCGQKFELRPEMDGRPPVRLEMPATAAAAEAGQPLVAEVLAEAGPDEPAQLATTTETLPANYPPPPAWGAKPRPAIEDAGPRMIVRSRNSTSELVDARRKSAMAMGGTVGAIVLGIFAILIAPFRFEAAFIAAVGVVMGIWGLYSPRRNWALAAMLLCCLAVGLGAFTGAYQLYQWIERQKPVEVYEPLDPMDPFAEP